MRVAECVLTRQADIDRLQAMLMDLREGDAVELSLMDGRRVSGIVAWHPQIQQFFDPAGNEGSNAFLRLEESAMECPMEAGWFDLFLSEVTRIRHLDRNELREGTPGAAASRRPAESPARH